MNSKKFQLSTFYRFKVKNCKLSFFLISNARQSLWCLLIGSPPNDTFKTSYYKTYLFIQDFKVGEPQVYPVRAPEFLLTPKKCRHLTSTLHRQKKKKMYHFIINKNGTAFKNTDFHHQSTFNRTRPRTLQS